MLTKSFVRLIGTTLAVAALASAAASSAGAQGMGGRGASPPVGTRNGPRGGSGSGAMAKHYEGMSSLKRALKKVEGLSKAQKDSLKRIESTYKERFRGYGTAAKKLAEAADAPGGRTDINEMRKLREGAETLQQRELAEARAVLTTDAQRARFDENVAGMKGEMEGRP